MSKKTACVAGVVKEELFRFAGTVTAAVRDAFGVKLDDNGYIVLMPPLGLLDEESIWSPS
jgi:hypothetical protein